MTVGVWLCAWAVAAVVAGSATAQAGPIVKTPAGALEGVADGGVVVFRNVPYAAPPVGTLRWRAPQPLAAWKGVRPAAEPGPACIQTAGGSGYRGPESEDCLSLNIFAPAAGRGARYPVMVWIHGGGFVGGTGSRYDGSRFARDGVVLVTINYRLGRLGFFAHPAIAATSPDGALADFGLMDQIAALQWVRANIPAFGGDPGNVTVFGESAGGQSVNALLASPLARGLFEKAISESSFAAFPGAALDQARAAAVTYAQGLKISGDAVATAEALRAQPASAFTQAGALTDPGAPRPIVDGVFMSANPLAAFEAGAQIKVPLIIGGNSFEASEFAELVASAPKPVIARLGGDPDKVIAAWGGEPRRAAADYLTFTQVIEPDRRMARDEARAGSPAWVYYFSYVPQSLRASTIGAWHGAEVPYVFDTLNKTPVAARAQPLMPASFPAATPEDEAMARAVHGAWVAFARTGKPGWPAVGPHGDVTMVYGAGGAVVDRSFDKASLDDLEGAARTRAAK
ncbi:MAG TPA: carboxylesterase family protein [Caulobacteraceae bacterium]|nr:carboxylesterase family protein [Caulobacteraceae bacterium]